MMHGQKNIKVCKIVIKLDTVIYKEQSSKCEFRENRPRDSYTVFRGVNKFTHVLATFLDRYG